MPEILEGKFKPMHSNPDEVRKATVTILMIPVWIFLAFMLGRMAFAFGVWFGEATFLR